MELREFLDTNSVSDGDKFCAALMRRSSRHMNLGTKNTHTYLIKLVIIFYGTNFVFFLKVVLDGISNLLFPNIVFVFKPIFFYINLLDS